MSIDKKTQILNKIKEYNRIFLFRHIRNDGDCVGATKGLKEIIKATWPHKEVYLIEDENAEHLRFMGPDDAPVDTELYKDALGIVLDTASASRITNKKFELCRELIKIDHHIDVEPYGNLSWVEEEYPSCCELIVEFYDTFKNELVLNQAAALYLYTGMVTDSGRFKYVGVSGDTMRRAGILLDKGIDIETLYAHLYLDDFDYLKFKAFIYQNMKITENGVAYIYISNETQKKFGLSREDASACVNTLDSIKGCICWIAFIENGDEAGIRARIRSRFVHINCIAEKYHGGGHACAAGGTVYNADEMQSLIHDADEHIKKYKESHEGWL